MLANIFVSWFIQIDFNKNIFHLYFVEIKFVAKKKATKHERLQQFSSHTT